MTANAAEDLNRKKEFHKTKELYEDPKNYKLYVSKKIDPSLNRKIKNGQVTLTLQDLIERDG